MKHTKRFVGVAMAAALVLAACGGDDGDTTESTEAGGGTETTDGGSGSGDSIAAGLISCDDQYAGKTITMFSSIRDIEADRLEKAYAAFEECTGADIQHEGSGEFEDQLPLRIDGGNAPDIAVIPQPGLLADLARQGSLLEMPADIKDAVSANFLAGFDTFGAVDGKFIGAPFGANVKSLVWYNPAKFAEAGYEIPQTWDELLALSDQIVADGGKPWCVGIESGGATGWVITDWFEDLMLRVNGPEVYDQWVAHEIPFNDPKVTAVADEAAKILKNEDYVLGGVKSMAVTTFQEGGLGILDGSCYMHRQANFYGNNFPEGTTKGPDGDVNTFYFPVVDPSAPKPVLAGGEFLAVTNDRPEVLDAIRFLTSADYSNARAAQGSWFSANKGLDTSVIPDPLDKSFADVLLGAEVARFDASDLMPGAVGAGTFWTETTAWITGNDTETMLDNIEASWPK